MLLRRRGNSRFHNSLMVGTCEGESGLNMKDANRRLARVGAGPFLDTGELSRRGTAGETKFGTHPLAGRRERFPAASDKFRHRHLFALVEVVQDNR
jgi:hypothetical protein